MVADIKRPLFQITGSAPVSYLLFNLFHGFFQSSDALILQRELSPVLGKNRFIGKIGYNYVSYAFLKMHLQLVLCFSFEIFITQSIFML